MKKTAGPKLYDVLIAGGGASGMMAAIAAAREGASVTLLERMESCGKKLSITGNGRCNLTNLDPEILKAYHSRNPALLGDVLNGVFSCLDVSGTIDLLKELGIVTCVRQDQLVYPRSLQAQSVLTSFLYQMEKLHISIHTNAQVTKLSCGSNGIWTAETNGWSYLARSVILCCGSAAAPSTGSDGNGYRLARQQGLTVRKALPALTALYYETSYLPEGCAGDRTMGSVQLCIRSGADGTGLVLPAQKGEIQWIEGGISGIAVLNLSGEASQALEEGRQVTAVVDLFPEMERSELTALLETLCHGRAEEIPGRSLCSLLPRRLLQAVIRKYQKETGGRRNNAEESFAFLAKLMKELRLPVRGVRNFETAQVCRGGVDLGMICPGSLECTRVNGLFFAGEILDVDGPCGGYNLQWAWSSGYTAGIHAARRAAGNG